jgi:GT2 family glycosyltransferase
MTPDQAYQQASEHLAAQRWAEALPLLEQAIQAFPHVAELRVAISQCHQRLLLGETPLAEGGFNQARYQRWIAYGEERMLDPLLPLRHDWWELAQADDGQPCWIPLHGGLPQPAEAWPQGGWLVLRHPGSQLRDGALQFVEAWLRDELSHPASDPHLIYGDEDRLDVQGQRGDPWFKPGFTPESFWSSPWLEGLSLWRLSWLRTQGLPLPPLDPEERWPWMLQAMARQPRTAAVPNMLSHWLSGQPQRSSGQQRWRAAQLAAALQDQGEPMLAAEPHPRLAGCFQLQWALPKAVRCTVVIPTRDRSDLLEACLDSLWRTRGLGERAVELDVAVVDNGSQELATQECFRRWRLQLEQRFQVIDDPRRFNWSALNNRAAASSDAELLLFLNNDIEALEPGWLEAMAAQALRPAIGCVGAVLLYPSRQIQHAGVVVGMHGGADHAYAGLAHPSPVHRGRSQLLSDWGAVTGACLMVRRELFAAAGGFDEAFPVEFNDIDFCLRLGQLGYRHVVVPEAVLLHHESQSRDAKGSATATDALKRLQAFWSVQLDTTQPWWPGACAPDYPDGRPLGLEPML